MITLVLGGARSGKSAVAEELAAKAGDEIVYLATVEVGDDADLAERVRRHQQRRPPTWTTVEAADLPEALRACGNRPVLVDSLGPWVARRPDFAVDVVGLVGALTGRRADTVVVSEEVGLGVHPETAVGRHWRDAVGALNQAVAAVADRVVLVVAGRIVEL